MERLYGPIAPIEWQPPIDFPNHIPRVRLAIVGSRSYTNTIQFHITIANIIKTVWPAGVYVIDIISGEATGVDTLAREYAYFHRLKYTPVPPEFDKYSTNREALLRRNDKIVATATYIIALPSRSGTGTQYTITRARQNNVQHIVVYVD